MYYELEVLGARSPIPNFTSWYHYASLALAIALAPYALLDYRRRAWSSNVERGLPRVLSDLEGLVESGLSPLMALKQMSQKDYGVLSRAIRRIVSLASWGYTYDRIKGILEREVPHPVALMFFKLLLDAEEGGGDVASAVRSMREYLRDVEALKGELQSTVRMQVFVVYLALLIFLYISETALSSLLTPTTSAIGIGLSAATLSYVRTIMFGMYIIEALLGGLALGKMTSGSAGAGVKHSMLLVIIGAVYIMALG
ncbi:MAG: type II secretion system F family protein [Conexivisphaera sp.]